MEGGPRRILRLQKRGHGKGKVLKVGRWQGLGQGSFVPLTEDSYPPEADEGSSPSLATIKGSLISGPFHWYPCKNL